MMPMRIQKQIEIAAGAATVWRFVGTEEGLRQWWGLAVALEAKPGGRCEEFIEWQGRRCALRGKVTTYEPPYRLALLLQNEDGVADGPAWTTIAITLTERNGRTLVTLIQEAFSQVTVDAVSGQMSAMHGPPAGAQGMGNRQQPQNFLPMGAAGNLSPTLGEGRASPAVDNQWLAQQATRWQDRLQMLAQQVLLTAGARDV
ncbi:MAG: SRPBCC domain-containing protein [Caldilinea sp. CFX5]|nr:SRPBCC domain-containing protein [Caldilinea sp. CFX5]